MNELGIYGMKSEPDCFEHIVETLLAAMEARNPHLRAHSERVADCAVGLAKPMGLGIVERDALYFGALLHDVGKLGAPEAGADSQAPRQCHALLGEKICRPLLSAAPLLPFIRSHHEKLDGSGFPDRLHGNDIPLAVQILAVANAYDNLRHARNVGASLTHTASMKILQEEAKRGWWNACAVELLA